MHDHDPDLIAEYASGLLTGDAATRVADLVDACPSCATEFADQQAIHGLLATAPRPTLSEFERTRLRRSVLEQLAPSGSPVSPWQRRFLGAVGAVAAVAVAVVGIGVLGQSGGEDTGDQVAAGKEADTGEAHPMTALAVDEESAERSAADGAAAFGSAAALPLLDITDQDLADTVALDPYLTDLTATLPPEGMAVGVDEAVRFGADCADSVDGPLLAVVIATVDRTRVEVLLTGTPAEPVVTILQSGTCEPYAP